MADRHEGGRPLAVVTGASSGLGEATAVALAEHGYDLVLIGRAADRLEATAARAAGHGATAIPRVLDLADRQAVARWIDDEPLELARASVLVNAAAAAEAAPFTEESDERLRSVVETDFFAPVALARAVLPTMLDRRDGVIVNIITSGARCALPLFTSYSAAKGALWAWSESLGRELSGTGVRVLTYMPPHMHSATQARLEQASTSFYAAGSTGSHVSPTETVAAHLTALIGESAGTYASRSARIKLALNAFIPRFIDRRVRRAFLGLRP